MPTVVIIAGPNGAGKSTTSARIVQGQFGLDTYVNADVIASGLSGFAPQTAELEAARIMLTRLRDLASKRANFAFETTLASRSFSPWLRSLVESGYHCHLVFVWLRSPQLAVARVQARVKAGGHSVPADTVRRRYYRGVKNFFELYRSFLDTWQIYDNSDQTGPVLIAHGGKDGEECILQPQSWNVILRIIHDGPTQ
mgnify:CR=1 FL=1